MGKWSCQERDDRIRQGLQIVEYSFALADEAERLRAVRQGAEVILAAVKLPCEGCGVTDCQKRLPPLPAGGEKTDAECNWIVWMARRDEGKG